VTGRDEDDDMLDVPGLAPALPLVPPKEIEKMVREGHLVAAARSVTKLDVHRSDALDTVLDDLRDDGFVEEGAILRLVRREPWLVTALGTAQLAGWVASMFALLVYVLVASFFAVVPAFAARLLVAELCVRMLTRDRMRSLDRGERRGARTLFDVGIYRTSDTKPLRAVPAALLTLLGICVYGLAVASRASLGSGRVALASSGGVLLVAAGIVATTATSRLARRDLHPIQTRMRPPKAGVIAIDVEPQPSLRRDVVFRRPRILRAALPGVAILAAGTATIASVRGPAGALVGAVIVLAAGVPLSRSWRSTTVIGPLGIIDVNVVRTRCYAWSDVHELRLSRPDDDTSRIHLRMIDADGADRMLVSKSVTREAQARLMRLVVAANHHAAAPDAGAPRASVRGRTAWIAVLAAVLVGVFVPATLGVLFETNNQAVDLRSVPAGRTFYRSYVNGNPGPATVECPSLAVHLNGRNDELCEPAFARVASGIGILLLIDGVFVIVIGVLVVVRRQRLEQRRRARRAGAGADTRPARLSGIP
jgi:hypothetical protein